ncbi:MAG: hypothetical protein ABI114_11950 [Rhodanobacter sp.]
MKQRDSDPAPVTWKHPSRTDLTQLDRSINERMPPPISTAGGGDTLHSFSVFDPMPRLKGEGFSTHQELDSALRHGQAALAAASGEVSRLPQAQRQVISPHRPEAAQVKWEE